MRGDLWTTLLLAVASGRQLLESVIDVAPFSTHPCRDQFVCSSWANMTSEVVNETLVLYSGGTSVLRAREQLSTQNGVIRLRGEVQRNEAVSCENHLMMMSGSPNMENAWEFNFLDGAVHATWQCNELYLVCPNGVFDGVLCEMTATISIELELKESGVSFSASNGSETCDLSTTCGLSEIALNESLSIYIGATPSDGSAIWTSVSVFDYGAPSPAPTITSSPSPAPTITSAPSPAPTITSAPSPAPTTSAPTLSLAPTLSHVPSPIPTTAVPTSAPSCVAVEPESAFELVGGMSATRRGIYVYREPCGCRPLYQCLDCMVDSSIFFDTGIESWVAASGGCGSLNYTLVAEDPLTRTPYEIGTVWNESYGTAFVPNSTIEVWYAVDLQGTLIEGANGGPWLGRYERRGTCDGRPAFEGQRDNGEVVYLYYFFGFWAVGRVGCRSNNVGLAVQLGSPTIGLSPLTAPKNVWLEATTTDGFVTNPSITVTLVDISPTLSPSFSLAPSMSPAPSSSPEPSTASPSYEPPAIVELVESPCFTDSWICATANGTEVVGLSFYADIRSTSAVFRPDRTLVTSARLVKDTVCGNHRVLLSPSPTAEYARRNNLDGALQIGWECDDLVILGPKRASAAATCPQDTYELRIYVNPHSTTVDATGLKTGRVCSVEIDEGGLDAIEDYNEATNSQAEMLFAYVGGDGGSMWNRLRIYENVIQVTAFPTPISVFDPVPTLMPSVFGDAPPLAEISCGFDDLSFCGWINGGLGLQGWRLSSDQIRNTADTGPTSPYAGEAYVYVEASQFAVPYAGPFVLESPRFELSNETPGYIAFQYHMFGSQMGNLSLEVLSLNSTWYPVWYQSGNQGDSWLSAVVELPSTAIRIRLVAYTGVGVLSDIAIDDLLAVYVAPTPGPSAAPSVTGAPTISIFPTITMQPSSLPTPLPVLSTRDEIQAAIGAVEGVIWIRASTVIDFSAGPVLVSTSSAEIATALLSEDAEPAVFDGRDVSRHFAVFNVVVLSLRDVVLRYGFANGLGGSLVVFDGGTLDLMRCVVESSYSTLFGGALLVQDDESVVFAQNTTFKSCSAPGSGGAVVVRFKATLYLDDCLVIDNHSIDPDADPSGGAILVEGSHIVASGTQFRANTVAGTGGALAVIPRFDVIDAERRIVNVSSDALIVDSTWIDNFASSSAGAIIVDESVLSLEGCRFVDNSAIRRGGALTVQAKARASINATDFEYNFVSDIGGGAILLLSESTLTVLFSTFLGNRAWQGGAVEMEKSVTSLYESTFHENFAVNTDTNWINCSTKSTLFAAKLYLDLNQTISAQDCSGYIYQINDDGSEEHSVLVREKNLKDLGSISFDHYTYPCDAGRVSLDGVEHGQLTLDRNGLSIDDNDPNCEVGCFDFECRCPFPCETCAEGRYVPWSLDKFQLANNVQQACLSCPAGRYLNDDSGIAELHDEFEDCMVCEPGRYNEKIGASECQECLAGTYSATSGATLCLAAPGGTFVPTVGAKETQLCPPGKFSSGGAETCSSCEPGTFQTLEGQTTCRIAPPGTYTNEPGSSEPISCRAGRVSGGGATDCVECSPGSYQAKERQTTCTVVSPGYFASTNGSIRQLPCEAGSVSSSGASECELCDLGRFNNRRAQTECFLAEPGSFVNTRGAKNYTLCSVGNFSSQPGQDECQECPIGSYCNSLGLSSPQSCSHPTTTSGRGRTICDACVAGYYWDSVYFEQNKDGECSESPCTRACVDCDDVDPDGVECDYAGIRLETLPVADGWWRATKLSTEVYECDWEDACKGGLDTRTSQQCARPYTGAVCGACRAGYDLDSIKGKCVACKPAIRIVGSPGTITFLVVFSLFVIYIVKRFGLSNICRYIKQTFLDILTDKMDPRRAGDRGVAFAMRQSSNATRGSSNSVNMVKKSSAESKKDEAQLPKSGDQAALPRGAEAVALADTGVGLQQHGSTVKDPSAESKKDEAPIPNSGDQAALSRGAEAIAVADSDVELTTHVTANTATAIAHEDRKHRFWTSVMTKAKICLAAYQITSATPWTLPGVKFPEVTAAVLKAVSILELNFVQIGSTDCVLRLSYFEKLVVVTMFPFALALIIPLIYAGFVMLRHRTGGVVDVALEKRRVIYGILLLFYVALPGCSSYTFRYFSCLRFDRGVDRSDLRALAIDLTIRCTSARYKRWFVYVILMIIGASRALLVSERYDMRAVWPIGCPLVVGFILWRRRHRLNPSLSAADLPRNLGGQVPANILEDDDEDLIKDFYRAQRHYKQVVRELAKIEKRNQDIPLKAFEFLYEEYEPRTFLFPVFEGVRRVFLTGVLAMFYPGSMSQVAVGMCGSMVSYRVFNYFQPYINDDDDIVSEVAQTQLVVLFFAAMIVFVAENLDHKDGIVQSQVFGILLLIVFSASFLVSIYFVLVNVFGNEYILDVVDRVKQRSGKGFKVKKDTSMLEEDEDEEDGNSGPLAVVSKPRTSFDQYPSIESP